MHGIKIKLQKRGLAQRICSDQWRNTPHEEYELVSIERLATMPKAR
jgi:hypothetical protein